MTKFDCEKYLEECKAGCCGCIPHTDERYFRNKDKVQTEIIEELPVWRQSDPHRILLTKDFKCPFLSREDFLCAIYEDRPPVCVSFGGCRDPWMQCPHMDRDGNPRRDDE